MKRFYPRAWLGSAALLGVTGLTVGMAGAKSVPEKPNLYPDARYIAPIAPKPGEVAFDFKLKGSILGLKIASARYKGVFDDRKYSVYADIKTSGLGALLKKQRIWATTEGSYDENGVNPKRQVQQNLDKKSRRVEMGYGYNQQWVSVKVVPRNGSQGVPPATPEQRFQSDDVISAVLKMILTGHAIKGEACNDNVKVFDSKQHYNLRMERAGSLTYKFDDVEYPAIKCHVYYEPIAGFDPEDLPSEEEAATPVEVYFINRPEFGVYMPVKFSYKISGFKAVIKVDEAELKKG